MKREFMMLAQKYDPSKHYGSFTWSVKLDGMRCFWDGGITRGQPIPWEPGLIGTGLYSRYMKPIFAPDPWLNQLPNIPLDGELWIGPGQFQEVMSICRCKIPDARWKKIKFNVIDYPGLDTIFKHGQFSSTITTVLFDEKLRRQLQTFARLLCIPWEKSKPFDPNFIGFDTSAGSNRPNVAIVEQHEWNPSDREEILNSLIEQGHEGIVLRKIGSLWLPERSHSLLKIKPWNDAEGIVIGCKYGRITEKGSKLLGKMGALIVKWQDKEFQLSGFTDLERTLMSTIGPEYAEKVAREHPGMEASDEIEPVEFPYGSKVTFKYRELSDDGIPKEARYWRKR
jgi:DNA ligase 1